MLFYTVNICVVLMFSFSLYLIRVKYKIKIFCMFTFIHLFFLSAIRYDVGRDFINYTYTFKLMKNYGESSLHDIYELSQMHTNSPGYLYFNKLIGQLTDNSQWVFIITSFVILLLIFVTIENYSKLPWLSVYIFMLTGYLTSFNIVRQYIAIGILFYAYKYIKEKKFYKYLVSLLIASLFHISALLFIPIYFISKIELNKKVVAIYTTIVCIILASFDYLFPIFTSFMFGYYEASSFGMNSGDYKMVTIAFFTFAIAFLNRKSMLKKNPQNKILLIFAYIYFVLSLFSIRIWIATRLMEYVSIFNILLIPEIIVSQKKRYIQIVLFASFILLYTLIGVNSLLVPENKLVPFQFFHN